VKREDATANAIWVPPFQEILDLKIQRKDILVVPLKFDFQCLRASSWEAWVDKEFVDEEFCALLERAGVLQAILVSRSSNMYRDTRKLFNKWFGCGVPRLTHSFLLMVSSSSLSKTLKIIGGFYLR
jgi:hypothetical protein